MSETAQPLVLPRGLIFLASLWLIGSWMITIGVQTPIQPVSASYTPEVVRMLLCLAAGLLIGWPLLRLSQPASARPVAQTVLDLVVLLALAQVVVWPLRLVTPWSITRTAAIDATLTAWLLLAGVVVATAAGSARSTVRCLAMVTCLALCLLGPGLAAAGVVPENEAIGGARLGPLTAVLTLGAGAGQPPRAAHWQWIGLLAVAAGLVWTALLLAVRRRS